MKKSWYQSKAIWGFGLAGIIALGQVFGITAADSTVAQIAQILTLFLGGYGLRTASK